jgi:hypothetical protein
MNVKAPLNPDKLADAWPKVEAGLDRQKEAEAIEGYLRSIDKKASLRPDRGRGRRWK